MLFRSSRATQGLPAIEEAPREQPPFQEFPSGENQGDEEEEDPLQGQSDILPTGVYTKLEDDLTLQMEASQDPILRENLEWEKRVIHSANREFFKYGDTYNYYHTPTLPLPLLKLESEALIGKLRPQCPEEEMGGYQDIDVKDWMLPQNMKNQPQWRRNWLRKHPTAINAYAAAPREIRVNPLFCPCIRRRSWNQFPRLQGIRPEYLNYPAMNAPEGGRRPSEFYMLTELERNVDLFFGIPDLSCMMLSKICKMLIATIEVFQHTAGTKTPWTRFFEGSQGLCWDLSAAPDHKILMGLFARLQFLPSHFMLAFEEAFHTGFFEQERPSRIFSPTTTDYGARYIAFSAAEDENPQALQLFSFEHQARQRRWQAGIRKINQDEARDDAAGPSNQ